MANTLEIVLKAKDAATGEIQRVKQELAGMEVNAKQANLALGGMSAAVLAGFGFMAKAAADEEAGIARLSVALRNVGVSYKDVETDLEGVIHSTQDLTGIEDGAQREALQRLLLVTQDYGRALKALPVTLDLAAAMGMDFASAAQLVGRALEGNTEMLRRYGINIKEGASETEVLTELTARFGGTAEMVGDTASGSIAKLKASIGDAAESFGTLMLPAIEAIAKALKGLVDFVEALPSPIKDVILVVGGLTASLIALRVALASVMPMLAGLPVALGGMAGLGSLGSLGALAGGAGGALAVGGLGVGLGAGLSILIDAIMDNNKAEKAKALALARSQLSNLADEERELRTQLGLPTITRGATIGPATGTYTPENTSVSQLMQTITEYQGRIATLKTQLEELNKVSKEQEQGMLYFMAQMENLVEIETMLGSQAKDRYEAEQQLIEAMKAERAEREASLDAYLEARGPMYGANLPGGTVGTRGSLIPPAVAEAGPEYLTREQMIEYYRLQQEGFQIPTHISVQITGDLARFLEVVGQEVNNEGRVRR